jgi:hypothetical protein
MVIIFYVNINKIEMSLYLALGSLLESKELVTKIRQEIVDEIENKNGNLKMCSDTLRTMVLAILTSPDWCFKKTRKGAKSRRYKASHTLLREGLCKELESVACSKESMALNLPLYIVLLERLRAAFFDDVSGQLECDFVDKFYKFDLEPYLWTLREDMSQLEHGKWIRDVIKSCRSIFNVSAKTRQAQRDRTDELRTAGLESPTTITSEDCATLIDSLKSYSKLEDDVGIAAGLCLLQLASGGRSRDVIFVNVFTPMNEEYIRVDNISKRKIDAEALVLAKPILLSVFPDGTTGFMKCVTRTRNALLNAEMHRIPPEAVQMLNYDDDVYPSLRYDFQWNKNTSVESVVLSWSGKMRRLLESVVDGQASVTLRRLFGNGRGTHQLRKLYVILSHRQTNSSMKEPAWIKQVLGHSTYDTSLLYNSMSITE